MSQPVIYDWFKKRAVMKDNEPLTLSEIRESLELEGHKLSVCSCNRQVLALAKSGFLERVKPQGFEWKVRFKLVEPKKKM